jgi:N-acetylmuramoyl-L-alanine amidase
MSGNLGGTRRRSRPLSSRGTRAIVAAMMALSLVPIDTRHAAWPREPIRAKPKPAAPTCDRARFRIVLDVGHTAEAPGAKSARNVGEFDFNLRLAKRIEEKLRTEGFAATRLLVTEGQAKPSLFKRVTDANNAKANLVLSIHHDSVPDSFLEEWDYEGNKSRFSDRFSGHSLFVSRDNRKFMASLKFARLLGNEMKARGQPYAKQYTQAFMGRYRRKLLDRNAGVYRFDQLIVLGQARMPAVLFEAGSIINRDEELAMNSPERQDMISEAVAGAVKKFCAMR